MATACRSVCEKRIKKNWPVIRESIGGWNCLQKEEHTHNEPRSDVETEVLCYAAVVSTMEGVEAARQDERVQQDEAGNHWIVAVIHGRKSTRRSSTHRRGEALQGNPALDEHLAEDVRRTNLGESMRR